MNRIEALISKHSFFELSQEEKKFLSHKLSHLSGVTSDSREVKEGYCFVAVSGYEIDGHQFLPLSEKQGASLLCGEISESDLKGSIKTPYFQVKDSREFLAELSAVFFGSPSQDLVVIGVTGTSGKTTVTYLLESICRANEWEAGVLGTVNFRFREKIISSSHTTPSPEILQSYLAQMRDEGCKVVIMEVSSHALKQKRLNGVYFDIVVFLNLSPEHLDYHEDMEDYYQSKKLLFTDLLQDSLDVGKQPVSMICSSDPYGQRLVGELKNYPVLSSTLKTFAIDSDVPQSDPVDYLGQDLVCSTQGIQGKVVQGKTGVSVSISSPLLGKFNVQNILAAAAVGMELKKIDLKKLELGVSNLSCVPGRMDRVNVEGENLPWVVIDYAHKPDALEKVLVALNEIKKEGSKLITVFGCGGDRDRTKRPTMGKIAVTYSDCVVVTSDNPRTEDPLAIIQEIQRGIEGKFQDRVDIEPDRARAISMALRVARPKDLVLVAGKGHEDYQIIGKTKVPFDDRKIVIQVLEEIKKIK